MSFSHIKLIYILGVYTTLSSTFALTQGASNSPRQQTSSTRITDPQSRQKLNSVSTADSFSVARTSLPLNLPLAFEANRGQTNPDVKFVARTAGYALFLTATDAVLKLHSNEKP